MFAFQISKFDMVISSVGKNAEKQTFWFTMMNE